jgi:hypothetical protein
MEILLLALLAGGVVWWFWFRKSPEQSSETTVPYKVESPQPVVVHDSDFNKVYVAPQTDSAPAPLPVIEEKPVVAPKKTAPAKKQQFEKKPEAAKAAPKPKAPLKPRAPRKTTANKKCPERGILLVTQIQRHAILCPIYFNPSIEMSPSCSNKLCCCD